MSFDDAIKFLKFFFGKNPIVITAGFFGGVGIVNVIDSTLAANFSMEWTLVPDWLRQVFVAIRETWQWLIDPLLAYLPFEVSAPMKDYMLMGAIVLGMRFRSSMVIWKSLKNEEIACYEQKTILPDSPIVLRKGELFKYIFAFLPIRLVYAFFVWPAKLAGALFRYGQGIWKEGISEASARKARQEQYMTFFQSLFWALFIVFVCLVFR